MRLNLGLFGSALFVLSLTFSSTHSFAADAPRWVEGVKVLAVEIQPYGNIYVRLEADTPDFECPGRDEGWLQLDTNAPNHQDILRVLVSAQISGAKVNAYSATCASYYPMLQSMRLTK